MQLLLLEEKMGYGYGTMVMVEKIHGFLLI